MAEDIEYMVRGALCCCNRGSHPRRVNLPKGHGVYINDHPVINTEDCVPEDNISYYGVCSSGTPPEGSEIITLSGYPLEGTDHVASSASGYQCKPDIIGTWRAFHDETLIGDEFEAVTTDSYLICSRGGIIKPITSGQEYKG